MERKKLIKSEVIQLFKTTKETLRYYEQMGLLTPDVSDNNYRFYDFKDLEKLRQIFLLRDLDLSIEEMKSLDTGLVDQQDYMKILKTNYKSLQDKIQRLQNTQFNIAQLVELLEKDCQNVSYLLRNKNERHYQIVDSDDANEMASPKDFYDHYKNVIETQNYSERMLQMVYPYDALGHGMLIDAKLCMEIPSATSNGATVCSEEGLLVFPKGTYLSVFYPFRQGGFDMLPGLKEKIENYLLDNKLIRNGSMILEIEHLELSLFLDDDTTIFELQIYIEKE